MLRHLAHWPLLGRVCTGVNSWADDAFEREQKALADHLAALERIMSGRGVKATPATPAAIDYLLRRSATIGLPLEAGGAVAGAGDWEETDVAALEDLTDLSLTPGDGYTTVSGVVDGRKYTGVVIVLTIGRMAPLPIPERMLPWQIIGDPSGEPLEWSDRIELHDKAKTIRTMRSLTGKIESQFDHYTVEHDQVPPKELAEQHARAQDVISERRRRPFRTLDSNHRVVPPRGGRHRPRRGAAESLRSAGDVLTAHRARTRARPIPVAARVHTR